MTLQPLIQSIGRGWRTLVNRKIYLGLFLMPIFVAVFFVDLMNEGLPLKIPVAVVDMDHSSMSRQITRTLGSSELLSVDEKLEDYHDAIARVRRGEIFGFFLIPYRFQEETVGGSKPTLSFYSNMTYYVPGTLAIKGFTTVAVSATAGVVVTQMASLGLGADEAAEMLQPVTFQINPLHNPWTNYSIYLSNSFVPGALALMIMIMTCFTVCEEMKRGTSPEWLRQSGGSMLVALVGKLLPQTIVWSVIGIGIQSLLFGYCHFPVNNHLGHVVLAMVLMVIACQSFSLIITEVVPNMRLSMSINCLTGILSFSLTGFSFPVQQMYGALGIFSYVIPLRYYFLIYVDQALNGIPLYYSRYYYAALLVFPLLAMLGLHKLRNHCLRPVYVP